MTATAYERIVDKLHDLDLRPRSSGSHQTVASAPAMMTATPSFAVYGKEGKAKVVCFAGCDDELDILPALEMTAADLYDERRAVADKAHLTQHGRHGPRHAIDGPEEKALDNLLHTKGFAEKLCQRSHESAPSCTSGEAGFGLRRAHRGRGTQLTACTGSFRRGWNLFRPPRTRAIDGDKLPDKFGSGGEPSHRDRRRP